MAISSKLLSANMRLVDDEGRGISSFRHINVDAPAARLKSFSNAVGMIRGVPVAAIFLTVTHELAEEA